MSNHRQPHNYLRPALAVAISIGIGGLAVASNPAGAATTLAVIEGNLTCATTGSVACQSYDNSSSGIGVYGSSKSGTGIRAASTSNYGLKSTSSTYDAIFGQVTSSSTTSRAAGVAGTSPAGLGVYGYTTSTGMGIGIGVDGVSENGTGVLGTSNGYGNGVSGESTEGTGVIGSSDFADGVDAVTNNGMALYAKSYADSGPGRGIYAETVAGTGVQSVSASGLAFQGTASSGNGADVSGSYIGIVARAPAESGYPLVATDQNGNNLFYVDGSGNLYYHGSLNTLAKTRSGLNVSEYSPRSSAPTVEDTGTGQLVGGAATVRLDPAFAATIDASTPYRVFVTPNGESRGLFVALKTPKGFVIRENQGGRSTVSFDYRIVAGSIGEGFKRMAFTSSVSATPHAPMPAVFRPHVLRLKFVGKPK